MKTDLINNLSRMLSLILLSLALVLASCTKPEDPTVAVSSISLNPNSIELNVGDTQVLTATVNPSNATNKNVTWSSSDVTVATVTDGKVTALKAGVATITVTTEDGGKTATCSVTVSEAVCSVEGVTLDKTSVELTVGGEVTLTATVNPSNATNKNVTWSSSDVTVATVADGKVTALKAGVATITVTTEDGGKTATCSVTVIKDGVDTTEDDSDVNFGDKGSAGDNIKDEDINDEGSF